MVVEENIFPIYEVNAFICGNEQSGKCKDEINQKIGELLEIAVKDEHRSKINLKSFLHWVKPAILHNQYLLLKREGDINFSGYIFWAWVDSNTLIRFMKEDRFSLHPSEWNEGSNLIVVDFFIQGNTRLVIRNLLKKVRTSTYLSSKKINICIRDESGKVIKTNKRSVYGK